MDFEKLTATIPRIVEVVATVPEQFRDRCFAALLDAAILDASPKTLPAQPKAADRRARNGRGAARLKLRDSRRCSAGSPSR